jgi:hypothetical protein
MTFPDDATGDVLRRMEAKGDNLSRPRDIDFTVVFPDEDSAQQFAHRFSDLGYAAFVSLTETAEGLPWDVRVVKQMAPRYEDIVAFQDSLQNVADSLGGQNDGWGCFSGKDEPTE